MEVITPKDRVIKRLERRYTTIKATVKTEVLKEMML